MSLNKNLNKAKLQKNDEFYTQLSDIENELWHYREHFQGKVVYCNCDDPKASNFVEYFRKRFTTFGLKRLVATCYKNRDIDLFSRHDSEKAAGMVISEGWTAQSPESGIERFDLEGNGDFRRAESIELLKQADIVVTNPPFSLFSEYVAQLVEYDKKFLIIGSKNAITYKEVFPLIMDNRMWLGVTPRGQDMLFDVPEGYAQELVATAKEGSAYRVVEGVIKGRLGNAAWFTNLDHKKRHEKLILFKSYSPEEYPTYDNYDAIEVSKNKDIPMDYDGVMGVPITFLDKHNIEQFELLGVAYLWDDSFKSHTFYDDYAEMRPDETKTGMSGKKANGLAVMRGRVPKKNYLVRGNDVVHTKFKRIFIRNKAPLT